MDLNYHEVSAAPPGLLSNMVCWVKIPLRCRPEVRRCLYIMSIHHWHKQEGRRHGISCYRRSKLAPFACMWSGPSSRRLENILLPFLRFFCTFLGINTSQTCRVNVMCLNNSFSLATRTSSPSKAVSVVVDLAGNRWYSHSPAARTIKVRIRIRAPSIASCGP